MANEVYANMMEVCCKAAAGKSICAFPDVCFTPPLTPATPPGVPIPYPNTGLASDCSSGSTTVKISGKEVMLKNKSFFKKSMGDEAGVAPKKGVITAKNMGKVYFNAWSMNVKVEGENVVRMLDITTHNHGSVPGNTPPIPYLDKVQPTAAKPEPPKKGDLLVTVINDCETKRIESAVVVVNGIEKTTGSTGRAEFTGLSVGSYGVEVTKHFKEADYSTFAVHYPAVLINHKAISNGSVMVEVTEGATARARVLLVMYRLVPNMVFHRLHMNFKEGEDKYGHWWTKIDANTSVGWWPKYRMGSVENRRTTAPAPLPALPPGAGRMAQIQHMFSSAVHAVRQKMFDIREGSLMQTLMGVDGELNAEDFAGTSQARGDSTTQDPHHKDSGNEQYQAVVSDCRTDEEIRNAMKQFSFAYTGSWSWRIEFGNHCHTFQKSLMTDARIDKVKKLQ